jgi:hypothetical protein
MEQMQRDNTPFSEEKRIGSISPGAFKEAVKYTPTGNGERSAWHGNGIESLAFCKRKWQIRNDQMQGEPLHWNLHAEKSKIK